MKIIEHPLTMFIIDDIMSSHYLDPVRVMIEDIGPGKGRLTVVCFSRAWHAYWGAMGDNTVEQFVSKQTPDYLMGCFLDDEFGINRHTERIAAVVIEACQKRASL